MGNRSSSVQPSGPPPLLSAAVVGNATKFSEYWSGEDSINVQDAQGNNVLHALFSCRGGQNNDCSEILQRIHTSLATPRLVEAHRVRNSIGCTPLWILIAYGNVALLKQVRETFVDTDQMDSFRDILQLPNNQGDSPLLATCSQGNLDMVSYLREELLLPDQFIEAIAQSNSKGTTALQIIVGNNHLPLLKYIISEVGPAARSHLLESNKAGLSLFHICSERNAHELLRTLLTFMTDEENSKRDIEKILSLKDKNGANALHVAAFCGNNEVVQTWVDVIKKTSFDDGTSSEKHRIEMLDKRDGQARTAYWLGMVQGHDRIGELLANEGVDISKPEMMNEIKEANERRTQASTSSRQPKRMIDGSALLGR
mmetsp:Transcript_27801/g.65339  ORF Transcript_27801/g.65339 Transcript_27801/m.65339 type:complete len:369 (+) Transcript_27801:37-1143(+)